LFQIHKCGVTKTPRVFRMRRTTRPREDNTMQRSGHAERPADSEARVFAALAERRIEGAAAAGATNPIGACLAARLASLTGPSPRFEPLHPGWGEPAPGPSRHISSDHRNVTAYCRDAAGSCAGWRGAMAVPGTADGRQCRIRAIGRWSLLNSQ